MIFREHFEVKKHLWGGEFWVDGYFVRTVGDEVTAEVIRKYIGYHRHREVTPQQIEFFNVFDAPPCERDNLFRQCLRFSSVVTRSCLILLGPNIKINLIVAVPHHISFANPPADSRVS